MKDQIIFEPEIEKFYQTYLQSMGAPIEEIVLGDAVYARRVKMPKWNMPVSVLQEPKIAVKLNTSWGFSTSKDANRQRSEYFDSLAQALGAEWNAVVSFAKNLYGGHGPLVSGIYRGHFPSDVKDRLRFLVQAQQAASSAAGLHAYLAKTKSPLFK